MINVNESRVVLSLAELELLEAELDADLAAESDSVRTFRRDIVLDVSMNTEFADMLDCL